MDREGRGALHDAFNDSGTRLQQQADMCYDNYLYYKGRSAYMVDFIKSFGDSNYN